MADNGSLRDGPPEQRVTRRFDEARVTERFGEPRPTDRYEPAREDTGRSFALSPGDVVNRRYRVDALIASTTGEAEIYRCTDLAGGEATALKYYRANLSPKQSVLEALHHLCHPNIVTVRDFGTWLGRFYEVSDFCHGGSLAEHMPFTERELEQFLYEMLDGLHYLHTQGIIHRDIKPNNLLFRTPEKKNVVLGDFGVSSLLNVEEKVRRTSTGGFFTLDYAAPELLEGEEISEKTDYYALGVTLLHLATGQSPFHGMDAARVLACHFRGTTPRPEGLSGRFKMLIDGLLRVGPEVRWGFRQVQRWLENEPILTDDGLPDHERVQVGKHVPYRDNPEITTPAELSQHLDEVDLGRDLQLGYLSKWLCQFDGRLGRKVELLEAEFEKNPHLGIFKLRYLLDPAQPLIVGDRQVNNLGELLGLLEQNPRKYGEAVRTLLYSQSLEVWLAALGSADAVELQRRLKGIRERVQDSKLALFALVQTLDPGRPFFLNTTVAIRAPEDLEPALARHPEIRPACIQLLYGGYFEEWLRAAFPDRADDISAVANLAATYKEDGDLALFALQCRFSPNLPFPFGTANPGTPAELARLIDSSPENFERGIRALARGWLRVWLEVTGRLRDTAEWDAIIGDFTTTWARKMEAVLHLLDPAMPWPSVACDVEAVNGGRITSGDSKTVIVHIYNAGRGHLSGRVALEEPAQGYFVSPREIEGGPINVRVTMNAEGLAPGAISRTQLIIESNGGHLEVPVVFRVTAPVASIAFGTLAAGLLTGELFAFVRLAIESVWPQYRYTMLPWFGMADVGGDWRFIPLAALLFLAIATAGYYLRAIHRFRHRRMGP